MLSRPCWCRTSRTTLSAVRRCRPDVNAIARSDPDPGFPVALVLSPQRPERRGDLDAVVLGRLCELARDRRAPPVRSSPPRPSPPLPAPSVPPRPAPPHRSRPAPPRPIVPAPPRPAPSFPPHHPLFPFRRLVLNSPNPRPNLTLPRPMCMVLENHWNNGPRASEDHTEFDLDHVTPPRPHVSRCPTPCPPSHARALAFAPRRPRRRSAAMASRW